MKPSLRFEVFKRDAFTCRYCGKQSPEAILEVDHVLAVANGGIDEIENLVTPCYECNRGKGVRMLSDIPPESDVHEKAIAIAEQERQIAELNYWRNKQLERENEEIDLLRDYGRKYVNSEGYYGVSISTLRRYLRHMCYADLAEMMEYVICRRDLKETIKWAYFCGMCRNRIREQDETDEPD